MRIPDCLLQRTVISVSQRDHALQVLEQAAVSHDSIQEIGAEDAFRLSTLVTLAVQHLTDFYARDLLQDSSRFNRMVDHISVTLDYVTDNGRYTRSGHFAPATTPYLLWHFYPGYGIYFQPVSTAQGVTSIVPRRSVPTDSVLKVAEQLYNYAIWKPSSVGSIPIWEYEFPWRSGGVSVSPPWKSAMAQGLALVLFTDAWERTDDPLWKARAFEVFGSMQAGWDDNGVRLSDTTHGFWWEEFHPTVMVWNGSVQALVGVAYFAQATGDSIALHALDRGIEAVKYYTPMFDNGEWTLYSLTQGWNSQFYHGFQISLCDRMYEMTQDPWFKETAERWRTYTPPPGVG